MTKYPKFRKTPVQPEWTRAQTDFYAMHDSKAKILGTIDDEIEMVEKKIHDYKATQTHKIWIEPWENYLAELQESHNKFYALMEVKEEFEKDPNYVEPSMDKFVRGKSY